MNNFHGSVTWTYDPAAGSHSWECGHKHEWQDSAAKCAAGKVRQLTRYGRDGKSARIVIGLTMSTIRRG